MTSEQAGSFLPSGSLETLQQRARILDAVRHVFGEHGYWEVETPLLSHGVIADAHVEPFTTRFLPDGHRLQEETEGVMYLQTSPELGMKRLLAAGTTAIFQITRAFRNGEIGRYHNPEFTMVEWYRKGDTYHDQMSFVETLVRTVIETCAHLPERQRSHSHASLPGGSAPFRRLTYDSAFERFVGSRVLHLSGPELASLVCRHRVPAPSTLAEDDRDGWLNLLLTEVVEPGLGELGPVFLYDYPDSQAALARIRSDVPPIAERFELYINGIEICNGYQELTDRRELTERFHRQSETRRRQGRRKLPDDYRLLAAMESGLPDCAGVALGLDRLIMVSIGASSVSEVMAFGFERA